LSLQNGSEICVDTVFRFEPTFAVIRGRAGGSIDEARGFFVPYDQMLYLKLDRVIRLEELEAMFGPSTPVKTTATPVMTSAQPTPIAPTDPAVASRLLLERIRAVRATAGNRLASHASSAG
jgi:hypothetical protein